ncbi:MAG TPA: hypothetical protein VF809_03540 [Candidatus Saccharimonadales bacterium]
MRSFPVNIVLLPSDELAQKAVAASKSLQAYGALLELNAITGPFPHVSLYMTQIKDSDLAKIGEVLTSLAKATSSLSLQAIVYHQEVGYIDVEYARFAALDQLQMIVINAINPLRDGLREKDKARLATATGLEHDNIVKYGYRSVGDLFAPHLTFTRFTDNKEIDTSTLPEIAEFGGQFAKLGLFEMGDNGTCIRKIAEFELGSGKA